MDLGDKHHVVVVFDEDGRELEAKRFANTSRQVQKFFARYPGAVVVMEAGTHSPWVSRLLASMGHEVWVGNPRKIRAIWDTEDKSDERDARTLGLIFRLEPRLLHPVMHRSEQAQADLATIKARCQMVRARSRLVTHVRFVVKGFGERLPAAGPSAFPHRVAECLPDALQEALTPILDVIQTLTEKIAQLDKHIDWLSEHRYPETAILRQVGGVGPITALAYVLTLEEAERFAKSRDVGSFLGLTPRRDQSGDTDKQLSITKAGDTYLRQLLVSCAHYILGPFAADSDLRRHGLRIAARGGKSAKKRAAVAVARKLAVLLHRLWMDQSTYVPLVSLERKVA
jgi:transposase